MQSKLQSQIEADIRVPVFRPTMEEFRDFKNYMRKLQAKNISFAKIIPPPEWIPNSKNVPIDFLLTSVAHQKGSKLLRGGFDLSMKSKNFIKTPLGQFKQQCSDSERKFFGGGSLSVDAIEDIFWAQLCKADKCYSLNNEISLFPDSLHIWNLNRLTDAESNLHGKRTHHFIDRPMEGIQTPFLYIGAALTAFGFHLEDGDLNSINFLHRGAPKVWYFVPASENLKLEKLAADIAEKIDCDFYIRHKTIMIPPSVLKANGIKFSRVIQNPGEFVVSFSGGYHSGFNCGYNEAEAVNFGTDRWLEFFDRYVECNCDRKGSSPEIAMQELTAIVERIRDPKFPCTVCGAKFTTNSNRIKHQRKYHSDTVPCYPCTECDSSCMEASALKMHFREIHHMEKDLADIHKLYKPVQKTAEVRSMMEAKKANTIKRKPMPCEICGLVLAGTYNLNRHMLTCRNENEAEEDTE